MSKLSLVAHICLAFFLAPLLACGPSKDSPSSTAEKVCRLINKGKRTEARKYFSTKVQDEFDKGLYEKIAEKVTENGKMKDVKAKEEKIEGARSLSSA